MADLTGPISAYNDAIAQARRAGLALAPERAQMLLAALQDYAAQLGKLTPTTAGNAKRLKALLDQTTAELQKEIARITAEGVNLSAQAVADAHARATIKLLKAAGLDQIAAGLSFAGAGTAAAQAILARPYIAAAIKGLRDDARAAAEKVITTGLAQGQSSSAIARALMVHVLGSEGIPQNVLADRRKIGYQTLADMGLPQTPENLLELRAQAGRAAMRANLIARSEVTNATHEAAARAAEDSPVVSIFQWTLSNRHPEEDACDALATGDFYGLGPGMYDPRKVPARPHPRCLCGHRLLLRPVKDWGQDRGPAPELDQQAVDDATQDFRPSTSTQLQQTLVVAEARNDQLTTAAGAAKVVADQKLIAMAEQLAKAQALDVHLFEATKALVTGTITAPTEEQLAGYKTALSQAEEAAASVGATLAYLQNELKAAAEVIAKGQELAAAATKAAEHAKSGLSYIEASFRNAIINGAKDDAITYLNTHLQAETLNGILGNVTKVKVRVEAGNAAGKVLSEGGTVAAAKAAGQKVAEKYLHDIIVGSEIDKLASAASAKDFAAKFKTADAGYKKLVSLGLDTAEAGKALDDAVAAGAKGARIHITHLLDHAITPPDYDAALKEATALKKAISDAGYAWDLYVPDLDQAAEAAKLGKQALLDSDAKAAVDAAVTNALAGQFPVVATTSADKVRQDALKAWWDTYHLYEDQGWGVANDHAFLAAEAAAKSSAQKAAKYATEQAAIAAKKALPKPFLDQLNALDKPTADTFLQGAADATHQTASDLVAAGVGPTDALTIGANTGKNTLIAALATQQAGAAAIPAALKAATVTDDEVIAALGPGVTPVPEYVTAIKAAVQQALADGIHPGVIEVQIALEKEGVVLGTHDTQGFADVAKKLYDQKLAALKALSATQPAFVYAPASLEDVSAAVQAATGIEPFEGIKAVLKAVADKALAKGTSLTLAEAEKIIDANIHLASPELQPFIHGPTLAANANKAADLLLEKAKLDAAVAATAQAAAPPIAIAAQAAATATADYLPTVQQAALEAHQKLTGPKAQKLAQLLAKTVDEAIAAGEEPFVGYDDVFKITKGTKSGTNILAAKLTKAAEDAIAAKKAAEATLDLDAEAKALWAQAFPGKPSPSKATLAKVKAFLEAQAGATGLAAPTPADASAAMGWKASPNDSKKLAKAVADWKAANAGKKLATGAEKLTSTAPAGGAGAKAKPGPVPKLPIGPFPPAYQPDPDAAKRIMGTVTTGPSGSNKGTWYIGTDGVKRYVKEYADPAQAWGEHLANRLYRQLGAAAPETEVFEHNGKWFYASRFVDGTQGTLGALGLTKERANAVLDHFAADVLTGNWDVLGSQLDNAVVLADGRIARIDNGGSFLFRAQAGRKDTNILKQITEWETFAGQGSKPSNYAPLFTTAGYNHPNDLGARVIAQIDQILELRAQAGGWAAYVDAAAPGLTPADRKLIVDMLESRTTLLQAQRQKVVDYAAEQAKRAAEMAKLQAEAEKAAKAAFANLPAAEKQMTVRATAAITAGVPKADLDAVAAAIRNNSNAGPGVGQARQKLTSARLKYLEDELVAKGVNRVQAKHAVREYESWYSEWQADPNTEGGGVIKWAAKMVADPSNPRVGVHYHGPYGNRFIDHDTAKQAKVHADAERYARQTSGLPAQQVLDLFRAERSFNRALFQSLGISTVHLYRNVDAEYFRSWQIPYAKKGSEPTLEFTSMSGWRINKAGFDHPAFRFEADFDPSEIMQTFFVHTRGYTDEGEWWVLGFPKQVKVTKAPK